ncbi:MAG: bifunctional diaminohydroxyphosphoribosylaminopyrimidine deaminase/5-amino-6-(5-phosphoribosylamino)uracil reductase RibD [Candidatus Diapherotrites archaeon]
MKDREFLAEAIRLAAKGIGNVSPNPMVGAVVVKNGKIIGRGWHKKFGGRHAEAVALGKAGRKAKGGTLYISLKPCCHYGKNPPCTEAIIRAGIKKVIYASNDPNPIACIGTGKMLKKAGVKIKLIEMEEALELNKFYFKRQKTGTAFVALKAAISLDGKIADELGKSKWISSGKSRELVHKMRNEFDAVMVGINTVLKDNPKLTCRLKGGRNPVRIVLDTRGRIPLGSKLLKQEGLAVIATTKRAPKAKLQKLMAVGALPVIVKERNGVVDMQGLMKEIVKMGVQSVLIEGGAGLNSSALKAGIVDEYYFFLAPKIMGRGLDVFNGIKLKKMLEFNNAEFQKIGSDVLVKIKSG